MKLNHLLPISLVFFIVAACSNNKKVEQKEPVKAEKAQLVDWAYDAVIYEVNIRQYTEEGTIEAFRKHLPRLKEMGIDILWLMPIHPIGEKKRKGELGSYYAVKDYLAVNSEFGTMEEFKSLVEEIHEMGMYVILDWVANHTGWDNNLFFDHLEWYTKDSTGNVISPVEDWSDVADLNYDEKGLNEYMINALKFWVQECDIDGYRCDVASMVPTSFWNKAVAEIQKIKPVFMLAEADKPDLLIEAFNMDYNWHLMHVMNQIAKGEMNANHIDTVFSKRFSAYQPDDIFMNFITNHDENSWNGTVFERYGDGVKTFAALTFTLPGMPLIYSGQEVGLNKALSFFGKDTITWGNKEYEDFYKNLISLRTNNEALWSAEKGGDFFKIENDVSEIVYSFARVKEGQKVICIFNLSPEKTKVNINCNTNAGTYVNAFNDKEVVLEENTILSLEGWEYLILL
jgi:alpha-amylase